MQLSGYLFFTTFTETNTTPTAKTDQNKYS